MYTNFLLTRPCPVNSPTDLDHSKPRDQFNHHHERARLALILAAAAGRRLQAGDAWADGQRAARKLTRGGRRLACWKQLRATRGGRLCLIRKLGARNTAADWSSATRPSRRCCGATAASPIPLASRCESSSTPHQPKERTMWLPPLSTLLKESSMAGCPQAPVSYV
jgi:hypothetical protein